MYLEDIKGGIKGIEYNVPLPLGDAMKVGDSIMFYECVIAGGRKPEIRHEDYVSANFYRNGERFLAMDGSRFASFEDAIAAEPRGTEEQEEDYEKSRGEPPEGGYSGFGDGMPR